MELQHNRDFNNHQPTLFDWILICIALTNTLKKSGVKSPAQANTDHHDGDLYAGDIL